MMINTKDQMLHKEITDKILRAYYTVYNELGFGFSEKCYENALLYEMRNSGLSCEQQQPIKVYYKESLVGEYFADIIVEEKVIIELKAAATLVPEHEVQLINYLKSTDMEIGMLLNFGRDPKFRRLIFSNAANENSNSKVA